MGIIQSILLATPRVVSVLASTTTADMNIFQEVINLITKFVTAGGGLWLVWGVIVLATGIKDKSGPQLQSGIWQIVGGGMIIAAAVLFGKVIETTGVLG
jgi:hypothetical protein